MAKFITDIEPDKLAAQDRGETVSLMEPLLIGESFRHRPGLTDLALELAQRSAGFRRSLSGEGWIAPTKSALRRATISQNPTGPARLTNSAMNHPWSPSPA